MLSFEEARQKILENITSMPAIRVKLEHLLSRVLAEPVVAVQDLPAFDNSSVDGYGVILSDVCKASPASVVRLSLAGEIRPGDTTNQVIQPGQTVRILTGAPIPASVEAVIMKEYCYVDNDNTYVEIKATASAGQNIRRRGAECLARQEIIPGGSRVTPPIIGQLAGLGQASFMVYKTPVVAIVSTGNELIKPGRAIEPGKIFDSNTYALKAALETIGIEESIALHASEDAKHTHKVLSLALDFADVIITAGGISVGEHDYVKPVLEDLGVKTIFWKIAVKPGKPFYFGTFYYAKQKRNRYVFGLPGNSVSALITYNQLVLPALKKLMGEEISAVTNPYWQATLTSDYTKVAGRAEFARGILQNKDGQLFVEPVKAQDSHMLSGLCQANALIYLDAGREHFHKGELVKVQQLSWY